MLSSAGVIRPLLSTTSSQGRCGRPAKEPSPTQPHPAKECCFDLVAGQGGEVVLLNMAYQCNQLFARELVRAVRSNQVMYIALSASTMVCAKSMEMTGELDGLTRCPH